MALYNDLDKEADDEPSKKSTKASTPPPAPGFLEPGSRSDALLRGFSNAATFGLAPRISAGANALFGNGDFGANLRQYLQANKEASQAHPGLYATGAAAPTVLQAIATGGGSLGRQALTQGAMGTANAIGSSENTGASLAKDALIGGATSGAVAALPAAFKNAPAIGGLVGKSISNPISGAGGALAINSLTGANIDPVLAGSLGAMGGGAIGATKVIPKAVSNVGNAVGKVAQKVGQGMEDISKTRTGGAIAQLVNQAGSKSITESLGGPSSFGSITDYLNAVRNAENPDDKRKAAMQLQSTPQGREASKGYNNLDLEAD